MSALSIPSGKKYFPEFIGLAVASVGLNCFDDEKHVYNTNRETAIELSFKKELFGRLSLQPNLQCIARPSGSLKDALVGILRLQLELL